MTTTEDFFVTALQESFFNLGLYLFFGIAVFAVVWISLKKVWRWRRIQPRNESRGHFFRHDILFSLGSILLAGLLTASITVLDKWGYMKLYSDIHAFGTFWGITQIFFLITFYDAYFYWTHRFMHHPKVYRWVHKTHHKSTDPSPLTIFSFHPFENLIEFLPFLVLPMLIPIYWPMLFLWQTLDLINNVVAHLGYEIYMQKWFRIPLLKLKTTSTHHNMHHELFKGNYGLYFTYWDRWMKTEIKDYEKRFDEVYLRRDSVMKVKRIVEKSPI
jgi:sterol desaturase/sphingolipid hydroxylase (fatty acid hydroxylase superfamily)